MRSPRMLCAPPERNGRQHRLVAQDNIRGGFTLIEVLTVIAIIAILVGLLIPVIGPAKIAARKASAKSDLTNLTTAVKAFYTDYGVYPIDPAGPWTNSGGNDVQYGNPGELYPLADVINVLRADPGNTPLSTGATPLNINTRKQIYLEVPFATDQTHPRRGLSAAGGVLSPNGIAIKPGDWLDPWGNPYILCIDADYDGYTQAQYLKYNDLTYINVPGEATKPCIQAGCIGASLGADGQLGTNGNALYKNSDDVLSWQ